MCPAVSWTCRNCNKLGHIAKCCRARPTSNVHHLSAQAAETQNNSPDTYEDTPVELVDFLLSERSQVTFNIFVSSPVVQSESSQSKEVSASHDNNSDVKRTFFQSM